MKRRDFLSATGTMAALGTLSSGNADGAAPAMPAAGPSAPPRGKTFGGCVPVTVTPYLNDHEVDTAAMKSLAARLSTAGCDGLFVAGSTGDMPFLSIPERVKLIQAARQGMSSDTVLYAGISDFSLKDHIENAKRFADAGADAAVLMAPIIFFTVSQPEVVEFFRQIADASPIPIVLYHHMKVTTRTEPATIAQLVDHPNIIGMKETGPTIDRTLEILKIVKGHEFFVLQGREAFLDESFKAGCHGCVAALAGVSPEPFVGLNQAWRAGDMTAFQAHLNEVDRLCTLFDLMPGESFSYFTYTLKRMLEYRGWTDNAHVRLPGWTADPNYDRLLTETLKKFDYPTE